MPSEQLLQWATSLSMLKIDRIQSAEPPVLEQVLEAPFEVCIAEVDSSGHWVWVELRESEKRVSSGLLVLR